MLNRAATTIGANRALQSHRLNRVGRDNRAVSRRDAAKTGGAHNRQIISRALSRALVDAFQLVTKTIADDRVVNHTERTKDAQH